MYNTIINMLKRGKGYVTSALSAATLAYAVAQSGQATTMDVAVKSRPADVVTSFLTTNQYGECLVIKGNESTPKNVSVRVILTPKPGQTARLDGILVEDVAKLDLKTQLDKRLYRQAPPSTAPPNVYVDNVIVSNPPSYIPNLTGIKLNGITVGTIISRNIRTVSASEIAHLYGSSVSGKTAKVNISDLNGLEPGVRGQIVMEGPVKGTVKYVQSSDIATSAKADLTAKLINNSNLRVTDGSLKSVETTDSTLDGFYKVKMNNVQNTADSYKGVTNQILTAKNYVRKGANVIRSRLR